MECPGLKAPTHPDSFIGQCPKCNSEKAQRYVGLIVIAEWIDGRAVSGMISDVVWSRGQDLNGPWFVVDGIELPNGRKGGWWFHHSKVRHGHGGAIV